MRPKVASIVVSALAVFALRVAVNSGGEIGISFLYVIPVGLGAWWFGRGVGLGVALGCLGLYVLTIAIDPIDQPVGSTLVRGVVLVTAALMVAELASRERRLAHTTDELHAIRQALSPSTVPTLEGLDVAVKFIAAEHGVSGDFYLLTNGPQATNVVVVGDVCGHGPAAAQRATFARGTLASVAANCDDPAEILQLVNHTLAERWSDGNFLTATCVVHNARHHHDPGRSKYCGPSPVPPDSRRGLRTLEKPQRTARFGVVAEDDDPDGRSSRASRPGSLVAVLGRHPDIGQHDVGAMLGDRL